jgi:RimJ/RimL family protein N-acetyltransferase
MPSEIELLSIDYQTLFLTTPSARIERENDPHHSPAPRLWLAGCPTGNVAGIRSDVPEDIAAKIMSLLATELPLSAQNPHLRHLDRYLDLLSHKGVLPTQIPGLIYRLPHHLDYAHGSKLLNSDTEEGKDYLASLAKRGFPASLSDLGFHNITHFWPPWCIAMHHDEITSIAITARLSQSGAEVGITTVPHLRSRGYAAAAVAEWSRLKSLESHTLFYSTQTTNLSSQRVAARLNLPLLGSSLRII